MTRFLVVSLGIVILGACRSVEQSPWQMAAILTYSGEPIDWQTNTIKGCDGCKIQKIKLREPDGISDVTTVYEHGEWRAERRISHQARIVFQNEAYFLLVKKSDDGFLQLENKSFGISIKTNFEHPFIVSFNGDVFRAVISQFDKPRANLELSDPLPVRLHFTVLKSQ